MRYVSIMTLSLTLVVGCGRKQAGSPAKPAPPIALSGPVHFEMSQRSTLPLPGSDGKILITIDDITAGQVLTTVAWQNGRTIVATRSIRPTDVVTFSASGYVYRLKLTELTNVLIGDDTASFELWPATAEAESVLSENAKIEELILSLEQLSGAKFIRNDEEHSAAEAVAHMRKKWEWRKDQIKTAEDFIRIAASKSSLSGEPYQIKLPDSTQVKSQDWFRKQLQIIEKSPKK